MAFFTALPAKQAFTQHRDLVQLRKEQQAAQERVAVLEQQKKKLENPDYLKALARQRLQYVLPGQRAYIVVQPDKEETEKLQKAELRVNPNEPWFSRLYETVEKADDGK